MSFQTRRSFGWFTRNFFLDEIAKLKVADSSTLRDEIAARVGGIFQPQLSFAGQSSTSTLQPSNRKRQGFGGNFVQRGGKSRRFDTGVSRWGVCFACGAPGHLAAMCPKKIQSSLQDTGVAAEGEESGRAPQQQMGRRAGMGGRRVFSAAGGSQRQTQKESAPGTS